MANLTALLVVALLPFVELVEAEEPSSVHREDDTHHLNREPEIEAMAKQSPLAAEQVQAAERVTREVSAITGELPSEGRALPGIDEAERLVGGAPASSLFAMVLNKVRDDTAAMRDKIMEEMGDIRDMMTQDANMLAIIMQMFPTVDFQRTLDAMRRAVTRQITLLQDVVGSGENLPNSLF